MVVLMWIVSVWFKRCENFGNVELEENKGMVLRKNWKVRVLFLVVNWLVDMILIKIEELIF